MKSSSSELSPIHPEFDDLNRGEPVSLDHVASPISSAVPNKDPISSTDATICIRSGVPGLERIDMCVMGSTRVVVVTIY
jgi:hypothetical protein